MLTEPARELRWVLFCALVPAAAAAGPRPEPPPFVLTRLALDLRVDYERATVGGSATLTVRNVSERPAATVPLLLNRLMTVSRALDAGGGEMPFQQQVVLFPDEPSRQVNAIAITPAHALPAGDSLAIVVHYGGILVGYTETGSLYIQDHVSRDFTIVREDAYAFPSLGVPSNAANRAARRQVFAFAARVTVPPGLVVAMGGEPEPRRQQDSLVTWSYHSTAPVPFLNIAIAPYRVLESAAARIFYFPADSSGAERVDQAVAGAVRRYTQWYGPLGPGASPRLTVMEIPEGYGSQASLAAGILQTADAFRDRAQLRQLYHELSHVWNVTDLDVPSPRWNEGLAMFLQWRMAAELDGWADWDAQLERSVQSLLRRCTAPARCDSVPFAAYGAADLTDRSYSVGWLMFYALYRTLGAATFDHAYADFFQRYREKGASSADLIAVFHRASARSDRIFADWFSTTRWYTRLAGGEPIQQLLAEYRQPGR